MKVVSLKDVVKKTVVELGHIPQTIKNSWKDQCPHCGYYCTGKSAFCTKHPSIKLESDDEES